MQYQNLLQSFRDFDMMHFFSNFCRFYRNDDAVGNDKELQNFINELSAKGTVPPNNGLGEVRTIFCPGGTLSVYAFGGHSRNFQAARKYLFSFIATQKAHFILRKLYMDIKYSETVQTEVRIASSEPRNICSTIFDVTNIMVSVLFGPRNITFGKILTQKHRTYLPICTCAELLSAPPPWDICKKS